MRLFSYIVRYDIGFGPNPFHGMCTLATCKQEIRLKAKVGDWVVGTGSKGKGLEGHLVYAMCVDQIVDFDTYWKSPQFAHKIPTAHGSQKQAYGDNIYHHGDDDEWVQANSRHSFADGLPNPGHIAKDTKADAVLIGTDFIYFGGSGPLIPDDLRSGPGLDLVHDRSFHRCQFSKERIDATVEWIHSLGIGVHGRPDDWE